MSIGDQVRRARIVRGWTQADLSERAGVDRTQISRIEHGQPMYSASTIARICRALDLVDARVIDLGS